MISRHVVALLLLIQLRYQTSLIHANDCGPPSCQCFSTTTMICSDDRMRVLPVDIPSRVKTLIVVASGIAEVTITENPQMTKFVLLNNPVYKISPHAFEGLVNLEELEISGSQLMALEARTFLKQCNLTKLHLNNNKLKHLMPGVFDDLQKLEKLHLKGNALAFLTGTLFQSLHKLQELDLSLNRLSSVDANIFRGLKELKTLNLDLNNISDLSPDSFNANSQLRTLSLRGNPIAHLPLDVFAQLNNLVELNLRDNRITELSAGMFPCCLKKLMLKGNRLAQLSPTTFDSLWALTYLDLSQNQLSILPAALFQNLTSLQHLDLSENQLRELPATLFRGLLLIKVVLLQMNKLSSLEGDLFKDQEMMSRLYLSGNSLHSVPHGLFDPLDFQGLVRLHRNPWRCDCGLQYLHEWLNYSSNAMEDLSVVHCASPEPLKGLSLISLEKEQLACVNKSSFTSQNLTNSTKPDTTVITSKATSTTKHCTLQEVNGTIAIQCKLLKCPDLTLEAHFENQDGSHFDYTMRKTWQEHSPCFNVTITLTV